MIPPVEEMAPPANTHPPESILLDRLDGGSVLLDGGAENTFQAESVEADRHQSLYHLGAVAPSPVLPVADEAGNLPAPDPVIHVVDRAVPQERTGVPAAEYHIQIVYTGYQKHLVELPLRIGIIRVVHIA